MTFQGALMRIAPVCLALMAAIAGVLTWLLASAVPAVAGTFTIDALSLIHI